MSAPPPPPPPPPPPKRMIGGGGPSGIVGNNRRGFKSARNTLGSLYAQYADSNSEPYPGVTGAPAAVPPSAAPNAVPPPPIARSTTSASAPAPAPPPPPPPPPSHGPIPSSGAGMLGFQPPISEPTHSMDNQHAPFLNVPPQPATQLFGQEYSPEPLEDDVHMKSVSHDGLSVPSEQPSLWMPTPPPSSTHTLPGSNAGVAVQGGDGGASSPWGQAAPVLPPPRPLTDGLSVEDTRLSTASEVLPPAPLPPAPGLPDTATLVPPIQERQENTIPSGVDENDAALTFTMHHGGTAPMRAPPSRSGSTGSNRGNGGGPLVSRVSGRARGLAGMIEDNGANSVSSVRPAGFVPPSTRPRSSSRQHTPRSPAAAAAAAALLAQEGGDDTFQFPSTTMGSADAIVSSEHQSNDRVVDSSSSMPAPHTVTTKADETPHEQTMVSPHGNEEERKISRERAFTNTLTSIPAGGFAGSDLLNRDNKNVGRLSSIPNASSTSLLGRNSALRQSTEVNSVFGGGSGVSPRAAATSRARDQLSHLLSIEVPSFTPRGASSTSRTLPSTSSGLTGSFLSPRATSSTGGMDVLDSRRSLSRSGLSEAHSALGMGGFLRGGTADATAASSIRHTSGEERRTLEAVLRRKPFDIPSFNPTHGSSSFRTKRDIPTSNSQNNTETNASTSREGGDRSFTVKDTNVDKGTPVMPLPGPTDSHPHGINDPSHSLPPPGAHNNLPSEEHREEHGEYNHYHEKSNPSSSAKIAAHDTETIAPLNATGPTHSQNAIISSSTISHPSVSTYHPVSDQKHTTSSVENSDLMPSKAEPTVNSTATRNYESRSNPNELLGSATSLCESPPGVGHTVPGVPIEEPPISDSLAAHPPLMEDNRGSLSQAHDVPGSHVAPAFDNANTDHADGEVAISFEVVEEAGPSETVGSGSNVPDTLEPEPVVVTALPAHHIQAVGEESSAARELSQGGGPAIALPSSMATPLHFSRPPSQPMHFPTSSGSQRVSDSPYPVPPPSSLNFGASQQEFPGDGAAEEPVAPRPPLLPPPSSGIVPGVKATVPERDGLLPKEEGNANGRVASHRFPTGALFGIFMPKGKGILVIHQNNNKNNNNNNKESGKAKKQIRSTDNGEQHHVGLHVHSMEEALTGYSDFNTKKEEKQVHSLSQPVKVMNPRFKPTAIGRAYWQLMYTIHRYSAELSQQSLSTNDNMVNPAAPLLDLEKGMNLIDDIGDELDPTLRAIMKVYMRDALSVARGGDGKLPSWGKGGREILVAAVLSTAAEEAGDVEELSAVPAPDQDPDTFARQHPTAVPYSVYRSTNSDTMDGGALNVPLPPPVLPNNQEREVHKGVLHKVQQLLCRGQREAAAALALENGLYTDALIISLVCSSPESLQRTVEAYTTQCLHPGTPLAQAYRTFNELPCAFPSSTPLACSRAHGNRGTHEGPQGLSLSSSPSLRHTWQQHAAVQLSTYNSNTIDHLLRLSDSLAEMHELQAAHACLLLCDLCLTSKKKTSRKNDSIITASVENSLQRDETLSQVSGAPLETSRSTGLSKADQQRLAQRQALQMRLNILGGLYFTKKRSGFLSPLTTTLTTMLQACRRGFEHQYPRLMPQMEETVPAHGIPSRDLRYAVALQCMTGLWLREVGWSKSADQILTDAERQISMTPLLPPAYTGEGYQWIPTSLNHLVFLVGGHGIPPAPTTPAPNEALKAPPRETVTSPMESASPPSPPTLQSSFDAEENSQSLNHGSTSISSMDHENPPSALSPPPPPPPVKQQQDQPAQPARMPPSQTTTPPPMSLTGVVSSNRRKELVPPDPPKPKRLGAVPAPAAAHANPAQEKAPSPQNAPESNGKLGRQSRKTEATDESTNRKRASSLDAIKNFFFRGRSQSTTDGKKEGDGKEKEEVKKMILDTEKPPQYDPVSGRWLFEQTEEEKAQAEAIKRGPPKINPAANVPPATTTGNNAGLSTGTPAPPSAIPGGPRPGPGIVAGRRPGLQRRPGGPLRPQYPDMFNSS